MDYYHAWFSNVKVNNFICDLSHPLNKRKDFIRYDMFKDGHKLDEFTDKLINERYRY